MIDKINLIREIANIHQAFPEKTPALKLTQKKSILVNTNKCVQDI